MAYIISPPTNWGNLAGIPSDLTDGKITWGEVMEKPDLIRNRNNSDTGLDQGAIKLANTPSDSVKAHLYLSNDTNTRAANWQFNTIGATVFWIFNPLIAQWIEGINYNVNGSNFILRYLSLPTSSTGLSTGTLWRDSNGFLRIV